MVSSQGAETTENEPGYCCHNGVGTCLGGGTPGIPCIVDSDCLGAPGNPATCSDRTPNPGGKGFGTLWLKFVQPVGVTTAGISTCSSNSPALDSIVEVFKAMDHSSPVAECKSLVSIGCNDDADFCGSAQRNSRLCLRNLTPGETYYIMLAAKTENRMGSYIVTVSTNCSGSTPACEKCPAGEVVFVDPPSGVVDARGPHQRNDPQTPEGIRTIVAIGPEGVSRECWTVCESPAVPASLEIAAIDESPPGTYAIHLSRVLSTGGVTVLSYSDEMGNPTIGHFTAHPANVNADSQSNSRDILSLIDYLNGVASLPSGKYSGDLDHSGVIAPADIITLIDLLNGNGFAAWNGTILPQGEGCP